MPRTMPPPRGGYWSLLLLLIGALSVPAPASALREPQEDRAVQELSERLAAGLEERSWATRTQTWLYRHPVQVAWLVGQVLPKLRRQELVTIYSLGASSGEEPASVAHAVYEALVKDGLDPRTAPLTIYAVEKDEVRFNRMVGHLSQGIPFVSSTLPEALVRRLNETKAVWASWITPRQRSILDIPAAEYAAADAVFVNHVAYLLGVDDRRRLARALRGLLPGARLYTTIATGATSISELGLQLDAPDSGFRRDDPQDADLIIKDVEDFAYRRLSRRKELEALSGVLAEREISLEAILRHGDVVTLTPYDARWIPDGRLLSLVPAVSVAAADPIVIWAPRRLRDTLQAALPAATFTLVDLDDADVTAAIKALPTPSPGDPPRLVVVEGSPEQFLPALANRPPVVVLRADRVPGNLPRLLASIAVRHQALAGRLIDLTRGPVERAVVRGRALFLLSSV